MLLYVTILYIDIETKFYKLDNNRYIILLLKIIIDVSPSKMFDLIKKCSIIKKQTYN